MKIITLLLFLVSTPFILLAQRSYEVGLTGGGSVYQGELNPSLFAIEAYQNVNPAGGLFLRYNMNRDFSLQLSANYINVSGDDAKADVAERRERNLSFKSSIGEMTLQLNYNLFQFNPKGMDLPFSPYIFLGVSAFHFNPKAKYNGDWVALQPLNTEGQGIEGRDKPYSLTQIAIPVGLGYRHCINENISVGFELGLRKTFTDYIDDVGGVYIKDEILRAKYGDLSANLANRTGEVGVRTNPATGSIRGSKKDEDWYAFGGVTVSYIFYDKGRLGEKSRGAMKSGCPKFRKMKRQ